MSNKNKIPAGNIQVSCHHCHWNGRFIDLKVAYLPNPILKGDVIPEICCPSCLSSNQIEFRDSFWQHLKSMIHSSNKVTLMHGIDAMCNRHTCICFFAKYESLRVFEEGIKKLNRLGGAPYIPSPTELAKDIDNFMKWGLTGDLYQWLADRYGSTRSAMKMNAYPFLYRRKSNYGETNTHKPTT